MGSWDNLLFNPAPVATWDGTQPPAAASPYGGLSPVPAQDYPTTFGPTDGVYDPGYASVPPQVNMQTTYYNPALHQPQLDPRADSSMKKMDEDEQKRQDSRCPSCAGARKKYKEELAKQRSCAGHVAVGAAAGVGTALTGGGGALAMGGAGAFGAGVSGVTFASCGPGSAEPPASPDWVDAAAGWK